MQTIYSHLVFTGARSVEVIHASKVVCKLKGLTRSKDRELGLVTRLECQLRRAKSTRIMKSICHLTFKYLLLDFDASKSRGASSTFNSERVRAPVAEYSARVLQ